MKRLLHKCGITGAALLLLFFIALPASAQEPIRIGVSLGLTGKYSEMSDMQMKGFRLWESDVNKRGGLLGKKVHVIIYDDKSDPRTAKSLYEHLILNDKVDLVFGPYSSEIAEAILPVTEKYGYPVILSGASSDSLFQKGYKYVFGTHSPASRIITPFLEMLTIHDMTGIAIVHSDDSFSQSVAEGTKKWAERFGLNVLLIEGFKKGTKNLDEYAKKARASKTQVLIVCGHLDEAVDMRLSLKSIGWYPKAYFAAVGPTIKAFSDRLGKDSEHTFSSTNWGPNTKFPGSEEFYEKYIETYKHIPTQQAAMAYAGGQLLEAAIKRAESLNREKIREKLSTMDTISIIGRYGVDKTGMQIKHFNLIIQWQNGKKEVVWPKGLKTANPVFR